MSSVLFSGGAIGADELFGECALAAGHEVIHYIPQGSRKKIHQPCFVISKEQLKQADQFLVEVNRKILNRTFPSELESINNLLRRNYFQIEDTGTVYAISKFEDGLVAGGTAWAVYMAIIRGVKEVYVYDQIKDDWFEHTETGWWAMSEPPPPPKNKYTGIGTRELELGNWN